MKRDEISVRQFMVLIVAALLMPATALLPTLTAQMAGGAGWLSVLGAIPFLLGAGWAAEGIFQNRGKQPRVLLRSIIFIMYMAWTFLLLMLCLRLSIARLESIYGKRAAIACAAALLLVALWMAMGKLSAFARAGEIFYLALAVLLVGVLLLATFEVEKSNFVINKEEIFALPKSSVAVAGLLLNVYPATVLMEKVVPQKKDAHLKTKWILVFCAAMALLVGAVIGCLGPKLAGKVTSPFLIMVQGLGVRGAFQRTEALVAAIWTLSDLILTTLLLQTWSTLASDMVKEKWGRRSVVPVSVAAIIAGWLLFINIETLWKFCSIVLPRIGLLLGFVCPVLSRSITAICRKRKK